MILSDNYYAFPDIHGCMDLLQKALDYVYSKDPNGGKIIFLGDYIDRGPSNKEVLHTVMNPPQNWEFVCLMGNHEQMFLDCFDAEDFRYCYDPNVVKEYLGEDGFTLANIKANFPKDILEWMRNLKIFHFEDMNVFAHAFYDPDKRPEDQNSQVCIWDRMSDKEAYFSDKLFLTHGHTPRAHGPVSAPNRINLDCGIYHNGKYAIAEYMKNVKGPVDLQVFKRDK